MRSMRRRQSASTPSFSPRARASRTTSKISADSITATAAGSRAKTASTQVCCAAITAGYTLADIALMRRHLPEEIGVEAAGGIRTLDQALEVYQAGCTRISTTSTAAILDEWQARLAPPPAA